MQVYEIMTSGFDFVAPSDPVWKAAEKMQQHNIGVLPVFEGNSPVGMLTDRDLVIRLLARKLDPNTTKVEDVMSHEVIFCREHMDVEEAAHIMEYRKIRRLLVKNDANEVIGVLSLGDIAMSMTKELAGEVLREVSSIAYPER
jgi:CBS domain-containing protein